MSEVAEVEPIARAVRRRSLESWQGHPSALRGVYGVESHSSRALRRHAHEEFTFALVLDGAHRVRARGRWVDADRGDLLMSDPHELRDSLPGQEAFRHWRTLYVAPELASELGTYAAPAVRSTWLRDPYAADRFVHLFDSLTTRHASELRELLKAFLAEVLCEASTPPELVPSDVARARALIDAAPSASHSLDALARASGLSRWHFVRAFGRYTGLPPHAYVMHKRIEMARAYIRRGWDLAQAATLSGFADQSHMTRVFRHKYGLTPRTWASLVR